MSQTCGCCSSGGGDLLHSSFQFDIASRKASEQPAGCVTEVVMQEYILLHILCTMYCMCQHVRVIAGNKRSRVRQDAETTVSIGQSVIQSVSQSVNSLAGGSFELSSKRNSLSPWCINRACALFPTAALLQSKEVGLLSIQIFSFVPMFSRHGRVRCVFVCVTVRAGRASVCMLLDIMSDCVFMCVIIYDRDTS